MSPREGDEAFRARQSYARSAGWAKVDPAERSRRMREVRAARTAKQAAEREARAAAEGKPVPPPKKAQPLPPADALRERMDEVLREREEKGLPSLTLEQLIREASLRERVAIAKATAEALRARGGAQ